MKEEWRGIPDFPGYEASSSGRIRSITRTITDKGGGRSRTFQGTFLKLLPHDNGRGKNYLIVNLYQEGHVLKRRLVHVLVCTTFHGPKPSSRHEVAHRDKDGLNNTINNLRWATGVENNADKKLHGTYRFGSNHQCAKLTEEVVLEILNEPNYRGINYRLAEKYNVSPQLIYNIRARRTWKHLVNSQS